MRNSKEYYNNLNTKFIKYWSKKRAHKLQFIIKNTTLFALPLALVLGVSIDGWNSLLTLQHLILTALTFLIYGCFVYFVEFKINEKRYQKLLKENHS